MSFRTQMEPWQERALQRAIDWHVQDGNTRALVLGGSIAHGFADERSDVDLVAVMTPAEIARRRKTGEVTYYNMEWPEVEWGGVDVKYTDIEYVQLVADRGNEATRWAFEGAEVVLGDDLVTTELLARITAYPEQGLHDRQARWAAQLEAARWFAGEGYRKDNEYLRRWGALHSVLFAGRLVLSENRQLFPFHKWLHRVVAGVPEKPDGLCALMDSVSTDARMEDIDRLHELVQGWRAWPEYPGGWGTAFMHDKEQAWITQEPPVEDL